MSVQAEINRIKTAIASAYSSVSAKGGTVPSAKTAANLSSAISSIPQSGGGTLISKQIYDNGTYNAADDGAYGFSSVTAAIPYYEGW